MASLLTAAAVLAAFRLPALMMFRGIRSVNKNVFDFVLNLIFNNFFSKPFRPPVMMVRVPMARSMSNPSPLPPGSQINLATIAPLAPNQFSNGLPWSRILLPPPLPPLPPLSRLLFPQRRPQFSAPLPPPPPPPPTPKPTPAPIKQVLTTPVPIIMNRDIRVNPNSLNNRLFYHQIPKDLQNRYDFTTTSKSNEYEEQFHHIFRPSYQQNRYKRPPKDYITRSTTTVSYNDFNSNQRPSVEEERRYSMMFPMPRNYQNHRSFEVDTKTTSPKTITRERSIPSTPTTTTTTTKTPRLTSTTKQSQTSTLLPINSTTKAWFRLKRIRAQRTTTTSSTVMTVSTDMTPAPLENYRPVKARISNKKNKKNLQQLMFDDTNQVFYYATIQPD